MFGFFKKNKKQKPDWSPFDAVEDHERFEAAVVNYFNSKNITHQILDGVVNIPNQDFGLSDLGLVNIAQYCSNEDPSKLEEHVAGHFDTLIRGHEFNRTFDTIKKDYDKVKAYLGVRLYNQSSIEHLGLDKTIGKSVGGDVYAMIVYDLPDTVTSVPPGDAEHWTVNEGDMWRDALRNSRAKYPANILNRELQGISFKTVEEDHFFSPNVIFDIANQPELVGQHGSLISLPTRHIVIIYPINDLGVVQALNAQIQVTHGVFANGPGSLSRSIFWYKDGVLTAQPSKIEEGKLVFTPTEDFVDMLNQLKQ